MMARFDAKGIEGLELSLQELAEIPDEVVEEMLDAAAEVTVRAHKNEIRALGLVDTGMLAGSIKPVKKAGGRSNDFKRHVLVYPAGKRGTRKRKKDVTNSEVGFVHEFGAPKRGIPARQWMRKANEKCAPEVEAAEFAVYDRWLKSKNL